MDHELSDVADIDRLGKSPETCTLTISLIRDTIFSDFTYGVQYRNILQRNELTRHEYSRRNQQIFRGVGVNVTLLLKT